MPNEADSRIVIDRLLREANWDIEDKSQASTEEAAADGRADYLPKSQRTRPLTVIEAKRFSIGPYSAMQRAREYAVKPEDHVRLNFMNKCDGLLPLGRIEMLVCDALPPEMSAAIARFQEDAKAEVSDRGKQWKPGGKRR